MPKVANRDVRFEPPPEWLDRSMIVWSAPPQGGGVPPNLVVAYDQLRAGEDLEAYVGRQLNELFRTAKDFRLASRQPVRLAGREAVEVTFSWAAGAGTMTQRQTFVALPDGRAISVASTAAATDFDRFAPLFQSVLSSFEWL